MAASSSSATPPLPLPVSVKDVYAEDFKELFEEFMEVAEECPIIACDTEFSGFKTRAPVYTGAYDVYEQMKSNIGSTRLVQIGFAFSRLDGNLDREDDGTPVVWHFNIKFDKEIDPYVERAIVKLEESDIDFERHKEKGIPCSDFVDAFVPWLMDKSSHTWVVFHGNYDLGLLLTNFLKTVTIPDHIHEFGCVLAGYFGKMVYDVKTMAAKCKLFYVSQKLIDYAAHLEVPLYGTKHQAGSDALVTLLVYHKLKIITSAKPAESVECANDLYQLWPC